MNNGMWDSECSSGCESGWTVYLEQSFLSSNSQGKNNGKHHFEEEEEDVIGEEEDMSMVSDASSGPPHFQEHDEEPVDCKNSCTNGGGNKRQKSKEKFRRTPDVHPSFLDDTASSPLQFDFAQKNSSTMIHHNESAAVVVKKKTVDFSQGYSATHFDQERSAYHHQQLGFIQYLPPGNQMQQNQWYGTGSMMGMR